MSWWERFLYVIGGSNNWHAAMKDARYEAAMTGMRMRVASRRMSDGGWVYYVTPAVPSAHGRVA